VALELGITELIRVLCVAVGRERRDALLSRAAMRRPKDEFVATVFAFD